MSFDLSLSEYLAQFGEVMMRSGHGDSWGVARTTVNGERHGQLFVFVATDPDHIMRATRVLGEEGLLCETTLKFGEDAPVTEATAVHGLAAGMRLLAGVKEVE